MIILRACEECGKEESIMDKIEGLLATKENTFITVAGLDFCCPECVLEYRSRLPLKKKLKFDFKSKLR